MKKLYVHIYIYRALLKKCLEKQRIHLSLSKSYIECHLFEHSGDQNLSGHLEERFHFLTSELRSIQNSYWKLEVLVLFFPSKWNFWIRKAQRSFFGRFFPWKTQNRGYLRPPDCTCCTDILTSSNKGGNWTLLASEPLEGTNIWKWDQHIGNKMSCDRLLFVIEFIHVYSYSCSINTGFLDACWQNLQ